MNGLEQYRQIFMHSWDAILLTSMDGRIHRANPAACKMFERTATELCKLHRSDLFDPNDPRLELAVINRKMQGSIRCELNCLREDGSVFPTDTTSQIFECDDGDLWTVVIIRDITKFKEAEREAKQAQQDVQRYADYDYLTGVYNRRTFINKFQNEIARCERERSHLSLLMLDIDFFKIINDKMGHKAGDAVLKILPGIISEIIRPYDILARYGGDEFIICLPNTAYQEAHQIAERLRSHIEASDFSYKNEHIRITVSIGVGSSFYKSDIDAEVFLDMVDKYLYMAKSTRNTVCGIKPMMRRSAEKSSM